MRAYDEIIEILNKYINHCKEQGLPVGGEKYRTQSGIDEQIKMSEDNSPFPVFYMECYPDMCFGFRMRCQWFDNKVDLNPIPRKK